MKQFVFYFKGSIVGSEVKETVTFPDDITDDEVKSHFDSWLWERSHANYYQAEDIDENL